MLQALPSGALGERDRGGIGQSTQSAEEEAALFRESVASDRDRGLPFIISAIFFDFLTPSPLVHSGQLVLLQNSRNLPYFVRFCTSPPSLGVDVINGWP